MANEVRKKASIFDNIKYFLKKWKLPVASSVVIIGSIIAIVFTVPMVGNVEIKDKYTPEISKKLKEILHADYKVISKSTKEKKVEYIFEKQGSKATSYMNLYESYGTTIVGEGNLAPKYVKVITDSDITNVSISFGINEEHYIDNFGDDKERQDALENLKTSIKKIVFAETAKNKEPKKNTTTVFTFDGTKEIYQNKEEAFLALLNFSADKVKFAIENSKDFSGSTKQQAIDKWIAHEKTTITKKTGLANISDKTKVSQMREATAQSTHEYFIYKERTYATKTAVDAEITSKSAAKKIVKKTLKVYKGKEYWSEDEMKKANLIKEVPFEIPNN